MPEPRVHLWVWRVPIRRLPSALGRMGLDRLRLRDTRGLTFAKLLGTGSGTTFTLRDADLHHWALLTVFDSEQAAAHFAAGPIVASWNALAAEQLRVDLRPLTSRGRWAGQEPFAAPVPHRWDGPVAAITRARILTSQWRRFWAHVPPVAADLRERDGLLMSMGIGEAPVGLQGTFSMWTDNAALTAFAQRGAAHRHVVDQTHRLRWYDEELFARFAVTGSAGTFNGRSLPTGDAAP